MRYFYSDGGNKIERRRRMKAESGTLKHDIFQSSRPSSYLLKGRPLPIKSDYRKKQDIPFPASNFSTSSSAWLASLGRLVRRTQTSSSGGRRPGLRLALWRQEEWPCRVRGWRDCGGRPRARARGKGRASCGLRRGWRFEEMRLEGLV